IRAKLVSVTLADARRRVAIAPEMVSAHQIQVQRVIAFSAFQRVVLHFVSPLKAVGPDRFIVANVEYRLVRHIAGVETRPAQFGAPAYLDAGLNGRTHAYRAMGADIDTRADLYAVFHPARCLDAAAGTDVHAG